MNRLLIADDHPIFRKGLVALVADAFPSCTIVESSDGEQTIRELTHQHFDVVLLDIDMPEKSGMDVLDFIRAGLLPVKPVILTMHNDELFFNEAFDRGAKGFVLKDDSGLELVECLQKIQGDVPYVSKKLVPFLDNRRNFSAKMGAIKEALSSLTKAELSTLRLVSENKSSREIAELLFVTEKSVENYRSRICKKLNLTGGSNTLYKWTVSNKELIR